MAVKHDNPALIPPGALEFNAGKGRAWNIYVMMMKGEKIPHRQCVIFAQYSGTSGPFFTLAAMYWCVALKRPMDGRTFNWLSENALQRYSPVAYLDYLPSELADVVAPIA